MFIPEHQTHLMKLYFKVAVSHEIFEHFFISLIQPIWAPDKQVKMVSRKTRFRGDIRILISARLNTAPDSTWL